MSREETVVQKGYESHTYKGERLGEIVPFELDESRNLWERQLDEPTMWYNRFFKWYLLSGPERTIRSACHAFRKAKKPGAKLIKATSPSWTFYYKKWSWYRRAVAFDDAQNLALQARIEDERYQMFLRHRAQARKWSDASMEWLDKIEGHRIQSGVLALRAWQASLDVEARSLIPPQILKLFEMSDAELMAFYESLLTSPTVGGGPETPEDEGDQD